MRCLLAFLLIFPFGVFARQRSHVDSLLKAVSAGRDDTNRVKVLCKLSFAYYGFSPDSGIMYGQQALDLSRRLGWSKGMAHAYNSIGVCYQMLANNGEALESYLKSLKINEETANKNGAAKNLGNIGMLYYLESDYVRSLEYLLRALKAFEEMKDTEGIATQLINIASVYEEQKMYQKALQYDSLALLAFRQIGDESSVAQVFGNVGNIYDAIGDKDRALTYHQQGLALYQKLDDRNGIGHDLSNIGMIYCQKKEYRKALEYQLKALEIFTQLNNMINVAMVEGYLGECYYEMAIASITPASEQGVLLDRAVRHIKKALEIHGQTNNLTALSYNYKILAGAQILRRKYKDAFKSLELFAAFKDSVFSEENKKQFTGLEHQRELDVRESKIQMLAQENRLKDLRADKERVTRWALVTGIFMTMVVTVFIVMYFVRRQKSEKQIANEKINTLLKEQELRSVSNMLDVQEEERKRIAADLHDRLGSMLSTVKLYFNTVEEQISQLKTQNQDMYHKATSLLDDACDEVRKISHNLVSGELIKFGLVSALNQLKETIVNTGKLRMNVLAFGMDARLDSATEISLYRVVQELMNNILKHANATEVTVQLNRVERNLNIVVEDNGVGFDAAAMERDGMGLRNMETRVKKLNGTLAIDSAKGRGTTTIIDIPV